MSMVEKEMQLCSMSTNNMLCSEKTYFKSQFWWILHFGIMRTLKAHLKAR